MRFLHYSVNTANSILSVLLCGENCDVKGLGDILLKSTFDSFFSKHFAKFFKECY